MIDRIRPFIYLALVGEVVLLTGCGGFTASPSYESAGSIVSSDKSKLLRELRGQNVAPQRLELSVRSQSTHRNTASPPEKRTFPFYVAEPPEINMYEMMAAERRAIEIMNDPELRASGDDPYEWESQRSDREQQERILLGGDSE